MRSSTFKRIKNINGTMVYVNGVNIYHLISPKIDPQHCSGTDTDSVNTYHHHHHHSD